MGHPIRYYRAVTKFVANVFKENPRADMSTEPKRMPSTAKVMDNFRKAVVKRWHSKKKRVSLNTYLIRTNACFNCVMRYRNRCSHPDCGCVLSKKCWWASERCPHDNPRWIEDRSDDESGV